MKDEQVVPNQSLQSSHAEIRLLTVTRGYMAELLMKSPCWKPIGSKDHSHVLIPPFLAIQS
jgi:hypothetical protein